MAIFSRGIAVRSSAMRAESFSNGKNRIRLLLSAMTTRVGSGSSAPRPANNAANVGMTFHRITPMTTQAMVMTAIG